MNVRELMQVAPVIPVIVVDDVAKAKPMAEALVAGGLRVLEITLRTPQALDAMKVMCEVEGAIVGVGTALNADDLKRAQDHGATFAVSPGFTQALGKAANAINMPLLPGIMTPADIMRASDEGFDAVKFFPAAQAGGPALLEGFAGPFINAVFCPTGGVSPDNARDYLSLPSVLCVGGSWVAPKKLVDAGDWEGITKLAADCQKLRD